MPGQPSRDRPSPACGPPGHPDPNPDEASQLTSRRTTVDTHRRDPRRHGGGLTTGTRTGVRGEGVRGGGDEGHTGPGGRVRGRGVEAKEEDRVSCHHTWFTL